MQAQHQLRYRKRVPVEFEDADGHHLGIVLNVSKGGLFVSSRVTPRVGSRVVLNFSPRDGLVAAGIAARVVWKRRVHRSAHALGDGGIGLEIEGASEVYEHFLKGLVPGLAGPPESGGQSDEGRPPDKPSESFLVRAALPGTPRTRTIEIAAASEAQAGAQALEALGDGWQVIDVNPSPRRSDSDDRSS